MSSENANVRFGSLAAYHHRISSTAALEGKAVSQTAEILIFDGQLPARSGHKKSV